MCLSGGTLREKLGTQRFYLVAETFAKAMAEKVFDIMFAGRDLFNRFPTLRPAGGFVSNPARGMELSMTSENNLLFYRLSLLTPLSNRFYRNRGKAHFSTWYPSNVLNHG